MAKTKSKQAAEISKAEFKLAKNAAQMSRTETPAPKKKTVPCTKRDERFFDPGKNCCWL